MCFQVAWKHIINIMFIDIKQIFNIHIVQHCAHQTVFVI